MNKIISVFLSVVFLASCGQNTPALTSGENFYGDKISQEGATKFYGLEGSFNSEDTIQIKLDGVIEEVCQAKGCWMTLTDNKNSSKVFIRFKDYAFFVPKDAGGSRAVVEGQLYTQITPVDELRHYAKDKGASDEEIAGITEPKKELRMMASGVLIYGE